jgi:transcriptional regulator with XRE-family HTH domain
MVLEGNPGRLTASREIGSSFHFLPTGQTSAMDEDTGSPGQTDSARARLGRELRRLRKKAGLTQATLAERLGYVREYVTLAESNRELPSEEFIRRCGRFFGGEPRLLGLHRRAVAERETIRRTPASALALASDESAGIAVSSPSDTPAEGDKNMERRAAMGSIATVLGATLLDFTGMLRQSNVGERMLGYIEADAVRFSTQYATVGPSELLPPVQGAFTIVRRYLAGHQPIGHRRRLCRAAAQLATVAGMTLFNLRKEHQARWAFRAAGEAAAEAEDPLLGAWVVASESMIPTYNGDPWEVLALTQRGQRLAAGASSTVVAKLAALEAKAHASLGNDGAAHDALAHANQAMATAPAGEVRPGVFGFTPAKYFFYEGTCHVRLGQPDAALAASQRALALYEPTRAFMEPTIARVDMAMAFAKKGDLEQACQLGRQIGAIPVELRTGPIMARVQEFFAGLEPRHRALPAVQEVREQLALPRPTETDGA